MVTWEGFECSQGLQIEGTGVYRINGNLAVARAIGDIDYRPWVSGASGVLRWRCGVLCSLLLFFVCLLFLVESVAVGDGSIGQLCVCLV